MKNLRYIIAASIAALSLSTAAYAVGDAVDDIGNGIGDAINDIAGGDSTTAADAGDVTAADTAAADTTAADVTTAETTTPDVTTVTTTPAVTTAPTIVEGTNNNKNPGTGVVAGFTAIGAAAAGLTAMAAKKRR